MVAYRSQIQSPLALKWGLAKLVGPLGIRIRVRVRVRFRVRMRVRLWIRDRIRVRKVTST